MGCCSGPDACSRSCIHSSAPRCTEEGGRHDKFIQLIQRNFKLTAGGFHGCGCVLGLAADGGDVALERRPVPGKQRKPQQCAALCGHGSSQAAGAGKHLIYLVGVEFEQDARHHGAAELVQGATAGGGPRQRGGVQPAQDISQ